jgi:universal stress protein A
MAEREGADLIVMSTHGRTGLSHMLLGSVTEKVVARAPCPVLAIPSHGRSTTTNKAA